MPSQEAEPKLPASVGRSPVEVWVGRGSSQERGTGNRSPRRFLLAKALLEVAINPIMEPIDPRARSPQAKQLPGREPASTHHAGDMDLIPGSGRSLAGGNGNPLQYSYLENSLNRGVWLTIVHGLQRVGHD